MPQGLAIPLSLAVAAVAAGAAAKAKTVLNKSVEIAIMIFLRAEWAATFGTIPSAECVSEETVIDSPRWPFGNYCRTCLGRGQPTIAGGVGR